MRSLLLLALLAPCALACFPTHFHPESERVNRHLLAAAGDWNYNNNGADWPGTCATGKTQSPIAFSSEDIDAVFPKSARARLTMGTAKGVKVLNTGTAVQIEWDSVEGSDIAVPVVNGKWGEIFSEGDAKGVKLVKVNPLQAHWHSTCEHLVDGEVCALELHVVTAVDATDKNAPESCKGDAPCLAVFGTKINLNADANGEGDETYQAILDNLPKESGKENAAETGLDISLDALLPKNKDYATYFGSLTAPPCSEGVQWHVFLASKRGLSAAQLDAFQAATANVQQDGHATGARVNNRQVMPVNGRTIYVSKA